MNQLPVYLVVEWVEHLLEIDTADIMRDRGWERESQAGATQKETIDVV